MSKRNRPHFYAQAEPVTIGDDDAIEDTIEVGSIVMIEDPVLDTAELGTVLLVDGQIDEVPLDTSYRDSEDISALNEFSELDGAAISLPLETTVDFAPTADFESAATEAYSPVLQTQDNIQDKLGDTQDKAQTMAQNVTQAAQDLTGKAQDAAQSIAGKAQDLTQTASDKAKDAAQTIAGKAADAKTAAAEAATASKSAVAGVAGSVGMGLWSIVQRSPLQAILFLSSLVWLLRSNSATASQTPVSVTDAAGSAAEKVGTLSGHVQVAASNLGSQVQTQAQQGAGWFSKTLQENPLVIGAMAIIAGAGLGLAVPETSYEHKTLGKTRDQLLDKAQDAAADLGHKVQTVAQSAVHDAIETVKTEAKNQGLAPQDEAAPQQPQQEQSQQQ